MKTRLLLSLVFVMTCLVVLAQVTTADITPSQPLYPALVPTATATPDPCAALTPAALQAVIDKLAESQAKAQSDANANGVSGAYAIAAQHNLQLLETSRTKGVELQTWLAASVPTVPYVENTTGAYNMHGYAREYVYQLHQARHWATISAVYHRSQDAKASFELTSQALDLLEALGAQAGRCYMRDYLP